MLYHFTDNAELYRRWGIVIVLFFVISWLHMGSSLTHCSSVVLYKPGDHTAGIMYVSWVHPSGPLASFSPLTNYPFGENLWNPLALSALVPQTIHLGLSYITNIVCAWNLLVLLGYMSSALVMYGLMYWLTKESLVAFFSGYAVTFTPYHAFASHGQIAGLLGAIFTLALWQFLALWKYPSKQKALLLGLVLSISFYIDGYFILIGGVLLASFWLVYFSYALLILRGAFHPIAKQFRMLTLTSAITVVGLLPLVYVNHHFGSQIQSILLSTRADIVSDAQMYSARLLLYMKPGSALFIGFGIIALSIIALWQLRGSVRILRKKPSRAGLKFLAGWTAFTIAIVSIATSLQPILHIGTLSLYMPSHFIISLTSTWRVFGRLYAIAAIGLAVLAGLGLLYLLNRNTERRYFIFGLVMLVTVVELRSFPPSAYIISFNYHDVPPIYRWLHNNRQVRAVAEYPLDEPPQGNYLADYYTFQEISGKPLLNSFLPNSPQAMLRRSIAGINDPQTLPVLRALGVDLVNIRPVNVANHVINVRAAAAKNAGLQKIASYAKSEHPLDSFLIKPGPVAQYALTIPSLQYFQITLSADGSAQYVVGDDAPLSIFKLQESGRESSKVILHFTVSADSPRQTKIIQNGHELWAGTLSPNAQSLVLNASADYPITIHNQRSVNRLTYITLSGLSVTQ